MKTASHSMRIAKELKALKDCIKIFSSMGGHARAKSLTAKRKSEIGKMGAAAKNKLRKK